MFKFFPTVKNTRTKGAVPFNALSVISIALCLGVVFGGIIGTYGGHGNTYSSVDEYLSACFSGTAAVSFVLKYSLFLFLPLLFSTSYVGGVFVFFTAVFFGFYFGLTISQLYAAFSYTGYALAALLFIGPVFLYLPGLLTIWDDCISLSAQLFDLRFGRIGYFHISRRLAKHFVLALSALLISGFYYFFIAYDLVKKLFC